MFQRMLKDPAMRVFLIHVSSFVFVVGTLAALNLWLTPDRYWFIWVLAGWGIALAAHGLALLLKRTRRRERIFIDPKARSFVVQLFAYVAVVLLLFVVNDTQTPTVWWFYWVALGWGAGVAAQAWCIFYKHRRARPQRGTPKAVTAKRSAARKSPRSKRKTPVRRKK